MKPHYLKLVLLAATLLVTQCSPNAQVRSGGGQPPPVTKGKSTEPLNPTTPVDGKLPGTYLKPVLAAYEAFKAEPELPEAKKQIENYDIELRQDGETYFIWFMPRVPPGTPVVGGTTDLSRAVTYSVRKSDYKVIDRQFYK